MKSRAVDAAEEAVLSKMGDVFSLKGEQSRALLATGFGNRCVKHCGALATHGECCISHW